MPTRLAPPPFFFWKKKKTPRGTFFLFLKKITFRSNCVLVALTRKSISTRLKQIHQNVIRRKEANTQKKLRGVNTLRALAY